MPIEKSFWRIQHDAGQNVQVFCNTKTITSEGTFENKSTVPILVESDADPRIKDFLEWANEIVNGDEVPEPVPKANWGTFNRLSVESPAVVQILTATSNQFAALKLQFISAPAGYSPTGLAKADYPLFQKVWEEIIDALPQPPTPEMIAELNAITVSANMDFSFDQSCKIVLADS